MSGGGDVALRVAPPSAGVDSDARRSDPPLRIRGLSKTFPGLKALDDVSLEVATGEILAVVGQNGSGKSTLVKILAGIHSADPGASVEHRELRFIHQDLGLVSTLSTIENLDLGHPAGRQALLPLRRGRERVAAREAIRAFGGRFDVRRPVRELAAAERTIVAIARAMADWSPPDGVLVLDEPTAALGSEEVERLFHAVRVVADQGAGVIFISHRLDEVLGLCDRILALRDGRVVADVAASDVDHDRLVNIIAGRAIAEVKIAHRQRHDVLAFETRGLAAGTVRGVDLEVRAGEIVGVAGLVGSGRDDIAGAIFGAHPRENGEVFVAGNRVRAGDPVASIRHGLALVPADRLHHGAVMTLTARENLTLPSFAFAPARLALAPLQRRAERRDVAGWMRRVELQPPQPERALRLFSGGNQQKIVIAKCLSTQPRVLLLDEPTQGVDVGAKAAIYNLIDRAAADGTAILVASSDTKELMTLCDRVAVLRDGRVAAELNREELSEARLVSETLGLARSANHRSTHE